MAELMVKLPDDLARRAKDAGLLSSAAVETLLRNALREQAGADIADIRRRMAEAGIQEISLEEIQSIVDEVRAEQRASRAPRS